VNEVFYKRNGFFSNPKILQTIWDKLGLEDPIPPFSNYFKSEDEKGDMIWRKYEINEKKHRSMFLNMEKIKLTNSTVLK